MNTSAHRSAPRLVVAFLVSGVGAFLGLSWTALAFVGAGLSLVGIVLFGWALSARRKRVGKRALLAWIQAVGIVVGLNALAWWVAIASVAVF